MALHILLFNLCLSTKFCTFCMSLLTMLIKQIALYLDTNASVVNVFIMGFIIAFKEKIINANIDSNEGGTKIPTRDRMAKTVAVIEAEKLVATTIPSRVITATDLSFDFSILEDFIIFRKIAK